MLIDRTRTIGMLFIILSIPTLILAFIAVVSSPNIKGPSDVFIDLSMRFLFVLTPIGLLTSGVGLLRQSKWGENFSFFVSMALCCTVLIYGISGMTYKGNIIFCSICFGAFIVFASIALVLRKSIRLKQTNK